MGGQRDAGGPDGADRPRRGTRTRERLGGAAREVFAARGFAATRVEDIARAAGVSHGTFYTYFANKSAALDALIDVASAAMQAVVDEPWDGPGGQAVVEAVIDRFVRAFASHADVVRVWQEAAAHDASFAQRLTRVRGGYVDRVAEVLAPELDAAHDPQVVAVALVAMVEGTVTQRVSGATDDLPGLVATLRTLWVGGVVAARPRR